jgi:hypothetical protein
MQESVAWSSGVLEELPGGLGRTLAGGTRNGVTLSRFWQVPLSHELFFKPSTCPFCTKAQIEVSLPQFALPGWKVVLPNPKTPHVDHVFIVPDRCWDEVTLQRWGGLVALMEAMRIAILHATQSRMNREIILLFNVGVNGSQNLSHAHMHFMRSFAKYPLAPARLRDYVTRNPSTEIYDHGDVVVVAAGPRTGGCLVIPLVQANEYAMAQALSRLIEDGNTYFASREGLAPAYSCTIRMQQSGKNIKFRYASYCPILENCGALQFMGAPLEGEPYVLRCSHEMTAAYLRGLISREAFEGGLA